MDPTKVKEPVVAAGADPEAAAIKMTANHKDFEVALRRPKRGMGTN